MICAFSTGVDDGERVIATERALGALVVATVRGLDGAEPSLLNEDTIPTLERTLMDLAAWADAQEDTCDVRYGKVVKGYGKKLFGDRTQEEREQMRQAKLEAYQQFVRGLSDEEKKERGDRIPGEDGSEEEDDRDDEEEEEKGKPWFGNAKAADADFKHKSFTLTPRWKEYKEFAVSDFFISISV
jgi:hypothetical protein